MLSLLYTHYTNTFLFIIRAVSQHVEANKPSAERNNIEQDWTRKRKRANISVNDIVPKINMRNLLSTIFIRIIIIISFSTSDIYFVEFPTFSDKLWCFLLNNLSKNVRHGATSIIFIENDNECSCSFACFDTFYW